jgi:broad specificity phosphatase PhoE
MVRHGETEWSRDGRHTGRTELDLTERGEEQARALAPLMREVNPELVFCSPRLRARRTAELAGLGSYEVVDDLQEWDYGDFEGRTTNDIHRELPAWTIWTGPWRGGETGSDVAGRADRLVSRLLSTDAERIVLVGHGHFSRVLAVRWVGEDVADGRWLEFDTACWSELGSDRGLRVLRHWNVPVADF